MNRHFGWALLLAVGVLFGCLLGTQQRSVAVASGPDAQDQESQIVDQLKEIKGQLRELNGMFRSGNAKVVIVINPGR
ncbi:MAG: hypothetical protein ABFC63_00860 [Thermoguttaceae bacterium]